MTEKPVADNEPEGDKASEEGASPDEPTQQVPASEQATGRIRYQDAESTTPREPTLAEQRARQMAEQRQAAQAAAAQEAEAARTAKRRKMLIGGGATVGVVALVAAMYSASEVSANASASTEYCARVDNANAQQPGVRADDNNCDENYVHSHGGYVSNGMVFMPLFLGGPPVPQYRYAYTSPGTVAPPVGGTASGSTFSKPSSSTVKSTTGTTISRGGFGISSKSGSSGS